MAKRKRRREDDRTRSASVNVYAQEDPFVHRNLYRANEINKHRANMGRELADDIDRSIIDAGKLRRRMVADNQLNSASERLREEERRRVQQPSNLGAKFAGKAASVAKREAERRTGPAAKAPHSSGLVQNAARPLVQSAGRQAIASAHVQRSPKKDKPATGCKPRPTAEKRSGGGASRSFVPWCDRKR